MDSHLWFVLTDPDPFTNKVVVVVLVSERAHTERTVCLGIGDHPFISRPSNVDFGSATFFPASKLQNAIATGRGKLKDDMSSALLETVRAGLMASSRTPNAIIEYCRVIF